MALAVCLVLGDGCVFENRAAPRSDAETSRGVSESGTDGDASYSSASGETDGSPSEEGQGPGALFDTPDEAARDFALCYNALSIREDLEYATVIFEVRTKVREIRNVTRRFLWWTWKGEAAATETVYRYSYTKIRRGERHSLMIPFAPFFRKKIAEAHTHGAYSAGYENDDFSPQDKNSFINYLATPLGTLRKYDPSEGSDIVLFDDIPFDPDHPGRKK